MKRSELYVLPALPYDAKALEPYISAEQLGLHHDRHHQAYVTGANAILEKLAAARESGSDMDVKAAARELSFQAGGHLLHSLFWENLGPCRESVAPKRPKDAKDAKDAAAPKDAVQKVLQKKFGVNASFWEATEVAVEARTGPQGGIRALIDEEFGSFERFKAEFTKAAVTTEGSGWAVLAYCPTLKRPFIMQVEKHNLFTAPSLAVLLVLDVWEHAYYLDYRNDRAKYVDAFWNIVNWDTVNERLAQVS